MSRLPLTNPPVGKSGPGRSSISSSTAMSGFRIWATAASSSSPRLWGGMLVDMPTAIPEEPFRSRFGTLVGSTLGSSSPPS